MAGPTQIPQKVASVRFLEGSAPAPYLPHFQKWPSHRALGAGQLLGCHYIEPHKAPTW